MSESRKTVLLTELVKSPKNDIVDGPFGSRLKSSDYVDSGVPIVRLQNIDRNRFIDKNIKFVSTEKANDIARHHFVAGDILISKLGDPLGEACIAPDHLRYGILVADVVRVRPANCKVDTKYLTYALNSATVAAQFTAETKGTTRPRVNLQKIRELKIPFIESLDAQRRVVAEIEQQFTRLDTGVAALRRTQANLKRYRAAVLNTTCDGWPSHVLSKVCDVVSGYAFKSSDFSNAGIPVIKIANVSYGSFLNDSPSYLPRDFIQEFRRFIIKEGDILLALTRPVTNNQVKACLYPPDLPDGLLNQRVAKITPNAGILRGYLLAYLRSEHFKSAIMAVMPQTLQPNLSPRDLGAMSIPLPPLAEQTRIVAEVERRLSVIEALESIVSANLQRANRLRQSILHSSFTEKI